MEIVATSDKELMGHWQTIEKAQVQSELYRVDYSPVYSIDLSLSYA